jgi:hypothetical protein
MADKTDARASKSYADRLDPYSEMGKKAAGLAALAGSPFGHVLRWLGVEQQTLDRAKQLRAQYERLVSEPERIAPLLAPLGWVFHGLAHVEAYGAAATLVEHGKVEEAEALLVETYNEDDQAFIRFYHRVVSLYQGNERRREIGLARHGLLDEAYQLHCDAHYAGAISIVLAQIDGIFIDLTGKPAKTFYNSANPNLVDDITIAGHPQGLKALSELMSADQRKTVVTNKLTRQGILHGRVLGYGTLRNSTKVWAALLAVIEAVGPRAKQLNADAASAHERRWTGSDAIDEWGRRRDRRGFDTAKLLLHDVHLYQHGHFLRHGSFAPNQATLDPAGKLLRKGRTEIELTPDGYYAYATTPTGVVFGMAARNHDFNDQWIYVDEEPPTGGIGDDERWRHITDSELSPDW